MRIKTTRTTTYVSYFLLCFSYGDEGRGFSFDCDKDGKVDVRKLSQVALANYKECMTGTLVVEDPRRPYRVVKGEYELEPGASQQRTYRVSGEVRDFGKHVHTPAVGVCECGCDVVLDGFTNTCECGRDYNMSGQLLAPREQWGEETGESLYDILSLA